MENLEIKLEEIGKDIKEIKELIISNEKINEEKNTNIPTEKKLKHEIVGIISALVFSGLGIWLANIWYNWSNS